MATKFQSQSLSKVFKAKGITTQAKKSTFIKANKIGLSRAINGIQAGTEVYWSKGDTYWSGTSLYGMRTEDGRSVSYLYPSDMYLMTEPFSVDGLKEAQKEVEKEQKDLTKRKNEIKDKLAFLKEAGVDSFTDNEFKAYMTLKTLEKKDLSDIEKAQVIAKLIDG